MLRKVVGMALAVACEPQEQWELRQGLARWDSLEALSRRVGLKLERSPRTGDSPVRCIPG